MTLESHNQPGLLLQGQSKTKMKILLTHKSVQSGQMRDL